MPEVLTGKRPFGRRTHRRRRAALLTALGTLAFAPTLAASAELPDTQNLTEAELRAAEEAAFGPEHAAEHARQRALAPAPQALAAEPLAIAPLAAGAPAEVGSWTAPSPLPVVGVHAALLPTGKVFLLNYHPSGANAAAAAVWDPITGASTRVDPPSNLWCAGHSLLPDGRVAVIGGNLEYPVGDVYYKGLDQVWTFNPYNETWTRQPDMREGRWYPTATTLPNGKVLITSGWTKSGDRTINTDIELFSPSPDMNGVGTVSLIGTRKLELYPHQFVLPSGKVAATGPGRFDTGVIDPATGAWTELPDMAADRYGSSAVLAPAGPTGTGRIMLFGGDQAGAETIDAMSPAPSWSPLASMPESRRNLNTVILPDGTLLTVGGNTSKDYIGPQREALLYNPGQNTWTRMASQVEPRGYHSTALLLPDGRVMSAGDDGPEGGGRQSDNVEIFSPPYLFKGPRPSITQAPTTVGLGQTFGVATPNANITRAALVALGSTTHANDMHQRYIELAPTRRADGLGVDLTAPASANVAVPGSYMLFLLNDQGVPSVASMVRITPEPVAIAPLTPPPAQATTTTTTTTTTATPPPAVAGRRPPTPSPGGRIVPASPLKPLMIGNFETRRLAPWTRQGRVSVVRSAARKSWVLSLRATGRRPALAWRAASGLYLRPRLSFVIHGGKLTARRRIGSTVEMTITPGPRRWRTITTTLPVTAATKRLQIRVMSRSPVLVDNLRLSPRP